MAEPHLILCGDATLTSSDPIWLTATTHRLQLGREVQLKWPRFRRQLNHLEAVTTDLVHLAAYVYVADQMISRGGENEVEYGQKFVRHLRFEVPVRQIEQWQSVADDLARLLGFLTDDRYEFGFRYRPAHPDIARSIFADVDDQNDWEEVMMFSGGLDSTAGAVQEALNSRRRVVLASHRSTNRAIWQPIVDSLRQLAVDRAPIQVTLGLHKSGPLTRNSLQRPRSFVFAALGVVIARDLGLRRVRFYENGITSLNLPTSPQVIGGNASRTTHPRALAEMARLFSRLFDCPFEVDNPFQWRTKASIIRAMLQTQAANLIAETNSCAHAWRQSSLQPMCGECSQCLDRRLTCLAAGANDQHDPPQRYRRDVLIAGRNDCSLILAERLIGATRVARSMDVDRMFQHWPELVDVVSHTGVDRPMAMERCHQLVQQHAQELHDVLAREVSRRGSELVDGLIDVTSLLAIAASPRRPVETVVSGAAPSGQLEMVADQFLVRYRGRQLHLGNTREFRVLQLLILAKGNLVDNRKILDEVWSNQSVGKNALQRVAGRLRKRFREAGWDDLIIDGSTSGHYRVSFGSHQITAA